MGTLNLFFKLAKMNHSKVDRQRVKQLTDLLNIGPAMANDLLVLGINTPQWLNGACPYDMYQKLCKKTGQNHDPCVIDVFISITRFMNGEKPKVWWEYTEERKQTIKKKAK